MYFKINLVAMDTKNNMPTHVGVYVLFQHFDNNPLLNVFCRARRTRTKNELEWQKSEFCCLQAVERVVGVIKKGRSVRRLFEIHMR